MWFLREDKSGNLLVFLHCGASYEYVWGSEEAGLQHQLLWQEEALIGLQ